MHVSLKQAKRIELNSIRNRWIDDPIVSSYVFLNEKAPKENRSGDLTDFRKYYEIYEGQELVGDIKLFYESEEDILQKRAQVLMVVGERNRGIGTQALALLIEREQKNYRSFYCEIQRSNVASLKILKRNGFNIDKIDENHIFLSRPLNTSN